MDATEIRQKIETVQAKFPQCGIVVSGGEPLINYKNVEFRELIQSYRKKPWTALETSGFVGSKPLGLDDKKAFCWFLRSFYSISLSPKVTPCLHGAHWSDNELCVNIPYILDSVINRQLFVKMVARDEADIVAMVEFRRKYLAGRNIQVYAMPWGVDREEVIAGCEWLVGQCAKHGFILSPRLHSILYGRKRGV